MHFIVKASVFVFMVLNLTGINSAEGNRARNREPSLGVVEQAGRVGNPYEVWNISIPGGDCVDLPGWTDSYGYGCEHYMEDEGDCETYSDDAGSDGKTPIEACCVCQNVSSSCVDLLGWTDFFEDSCDWYEENEPVGCPAEGHVNGTNNVNASEACCHCHRGNTRGRWSEFNQQQEPVSLDSGTDFANGVLYWVIAVGVILALCLFCFCCCGVGAMAAVAA